MDRILQPGRNCWRVERAGRAAVLVDVAAYFAVLPEALERAERSILILGWDIHSRCRLGPRREPGDGEELADLLDRITRARPELEVRILSWDPSPIYALEREAMATLVFDWRTNDRVDVRLADDHPAGASHHQKVVIVDDRVAFVGGMDLTISRWDTPSHDPDDPRRRLPRGDAYPPFHDVQLALDGDAAKALGELARERWRRATGESLDAPETASDPWPPSLAVGGRDVEVALARTEPHHDDREPVSEVEALFLDAIAGAQRTLYVENQYLSSQEIATALSERLAAPDGPEIVFVSPLHQAGRLEKSTMGVLRARLLRDLRKTDAHGRLRVLSPVAGGDHGINVHSKVMVVDDRMLRVGSANMSNRSMSLDTECDAAIESDDEDTRAWITGVRDGLLAEHLGVDRAAVRAAIEREGTLRAAIDALREAGGDRTLVNLEPELDETLDALLPDASLIDPGRGLDEALVRRALPREAALAGSRRMPRLWVAVLAALAIAVPWALIAMGVAPAPRQLVEALRQAFSHPAAPWVAVPVFVLAALSMVPVTVLIALSVLAFGPWIGGGVAFAGSLLGAAAGYGIGRGLPPERRGRLGGQHARTISELAERGLLGIIALRLVPIAPFAASNLVLGGAASSLRDTLVGTALGVTPGIVVFAFVTTRVTAALRDPGPLSITVAVVSVLAVGGALLGLRRLLRRRLAGEPGKPREPREPRSSAA